MCYLLLELSQSDWRSRDLSPDLLTEGLKLFHSGAAASTLPRGPGQAAVLQPGPGMGGGRPGSATLRPLGQLTAISLEPRQLPLCNKGLD